MDDRTGKIYDSEQLDELVKVHDGKLVSRREQLAEHLVELTDAQAKELQPKPLKERLNWLDDLRAERAKAKARERGE